MSPDFTWVLLLGSALVGEHGRLSHGCRPTLYEMKITKGHFGAHSSSLPIGSQP